MRVTQSVKKLVAYTPGEQPKTKNVVKLNTNENPYPPSPRCADVLASFDPDCLRRYPDPVFSELRAAIARLHRTVPARVFVGNGSDEILSLAARAFVENDERIGSLDPSYSLYKTLAAIRGVRWTGVREPEDAATDKKIALFLLTNPNAPTGEFRPRERVAAFAASFPGVVLVDEAYADFARGDCMKLATAKDNASVLVMRTFSKSYSLAGLRVGYCVGPEELIDALYKVKDSYNVDAVAQAVALAALRDRASLAASVSRVRRTRRAFCRELKKRGWTFPESEANFVFARPPAPLRADELFEALRTRGIFVRYFPGPLTGDALRITIGTDAQMKTLLDALDGIYLA
jgi:histidinol-phosphate aminotransferase